MGSVAQIEKVKNYDRGSNLRPGSLQFRACEMEKIKK